MVQPDIYTRYKSDPFFSLKITLSNEFTLLVHWNIFLDKKNDNKPVIRHKNI